MNYKIYFYYHHHKIKLSSSTNKQQTTDRQISQQPCVERFQLPPQQLSRRMSATRQLRRSTQKKIFLHRTNIHPATHHPKTAQNRMKPRAKEIPIASSTANASPTMSSHKNNLPGRKPSGRRTPTGGRCTTAWWPTKKNSTPPGSRRATRKTRHLADGSTVSDTTVRNRQRLIS